MMTMMQRSSAAAFRSLSASTATRSSRAAASRLAATTSRSTSAAAAASSPFRSPLTVTALRYSSTTTSSSSAAAAEAAAPASEEAPDSENHHVPAQFSSLKGKVSDPTLKALVSNPFNFKAMSAVQERVLTRLPDLIDPTNPAFEDLLVKAKTGTGKTIAFLVPAVEARIRAIQAVKDGTYGYLPPWEDLLKANRPEFFEGKPNGQPLDYSSIDKAERTKLAKLFRKHTAGTLILSPTRELATQIATEARKLYTHHSTVTGRPSGGRSTQPDCVHLLVGGVSRGGQKRQLLDGTPDVIVGTPGRVLDFLSDDAYVKSALATCQTFILDEADTLLDMGFREDIRKITQALPNANVIVRNKRSGRDDVEGTAAAAAEESDVKPLTRQTFLFSATASKEIQSVATWALGEKNDFINCVAKGDDQTHAHIPQKAYIMPSAPEQFKQVVRLIQHDQLIHPGKSKVIVFAPTTLLVQFIAAYLRSAVRAGGFPANTKDKYGGADEPPGAGGSVYELHSKLAQDRRFRRSARFRADGSGGAILVTSDVSARGVDYPGTTRVIQFGVTNSKENYIHRIGRTGRAQHQGGRADMVLQDWEASFIQGALRDLPVQIGIAGEVEKEVKELASGFDEKGFAGLKLDDDALQALNKAVAASSPQRAAKGGNRRFSFGSSSRPRGDPPSGPAPWQAPILPKLENEKLFLEGNDDRESVRELMMSMIGFYGSVSSSDMRNSSADRVRGLQRWTEQLTGEPGSGYVSPSFLAKLGVSDRVGSRGSSGGRGRGGGGGGFGSRGRSGSFDSRQERGHWADINNGGGRSSRGGSSSFQQRREGSGDFGGYKRFSNDRNSNYSSRATSFNRRGDRDGDGDRSRSGRRQFGDDTFSRSRSSSFDRDSF